MYQTIRRIPLALVLLCSLSGQVHAAACPTKVTKQNGSDAGTLNFLAGLGCSPITFAAALAGKMVFVPETVALKSNVRVDGSDLPAPVTITSTTNNLKSIFTLGTRNILLGLTITPAPFTPGNETVAVLITKAGPETGSGNLVKQCTITGGTTGVVVNIGARNLITNNSFAAITKFPLRLDNHGNQDLAAPNVFAAVQNDENNWTLTGFVPDNTATVEVYAADLSDGALPPQGKTLVGTSNTFIGDGQFTITFGLLEVAPETTLTALTIDTSNNTSQFSEFIQPLALPDAAAFTALVDPDQDGKMNWEDNCPNTFNPNQVDADGDGLGNVCDNCPDVKAADQTDTDTDALGDVCDADIDGDGIFQPKDNCAFAVNPDQTDTDSDGLGNACELDNNDNDGDGALDISDNCPTIKNPQQEDTDADTIGNACDEDIDNDGIKNPPDNCPFAANAEQSDADQDGSGDACELPDVAADGGAQPDTSTPPDTSDQDGDGAADGVDNCPTVFNVVQEDPDADGLGNECDLDDDGDGFADVIEGEDDPDGDGIPNRLDLDSNGDGILDRDSPTDANQNGVPDYLEGLANVGTPFSTIDSGGCALLVE